MIDNGVGYYALVRAPRIEHNLDFTEDYRHANQTFREPRIDEHARQLLAAYEQSLAKLADVLTPARATPRQAAEAEQPLRSGRG